MKITFYSNFLTHHQVPFCLEMQKKYGEDFKFISTEKITEERLKLGYKDIDPNYDFVIRTYESEENYQKAMELSIISDVAIFGSTKTDEFAVQRLKQDKITFRYYARIFYGKLDIENYKKVYQRHFKFKKNKNLYLLCASGYGPNDFNKFGIYKNKCFKWGYFPETKEYDIYELVNQKEKNAVIKILWVGRFIKEKHPEYMIKLAKKLKDNNYNFKIQMIGNGELFNKIKSKIDIKKLNSNIELIGAIDSDKVRNYMEQANIFACTSDKFERWGVVLNEAMNSGCAVVANKDIGGIPFLIKNNKNGLVYRNLKDFCSKIIKLLNNKEDRKQISVNAYNTIINNWTAKKAVDNFSIMIEDIMNNRKTSIKTGPASQALPIKKIL